MQFEQWEEELSAFGESDLDVAMSDNDWETPDDEPAGDEEIVAPSAEEIEALMSQIATVPETPTLEPAPQLPEIAAAPEPVSATKPADVVTIASLDAELREAFLDDASSCVGSMEQSLLRLESDPSDAEALNQICRELHTLKGASASVGLSDLADQLHQLEDTLRDDHDAGRAPDIDALLKSVDSIRSQVGGSEVQADQEVVVNPAAAPDSIPQPAIASFVDSSDDDEMVRVKSSQLNRLMDMLAQLVMLRNRRESELSELQEIYHELIGSVSKMRLLSNETDPAAAVCSSLQLSEVANDVLEVAQQVRECSRPISDGNTAVSQFIREFRQELVELRRTPIGGLFRRLQRVVRDAAQAESKEVRLELIGEDAGIERSLQQRLYEPLLHIVRNSVCHGIESPDQRQQAGKDRQGTITLQAKSGPDLFVIEICDDGKGLDYEAIRRRGIESGLLKSDQAATEQQLSQLIFQPGFSTRQTTDQVAGRGVGMDVVASTLQRMRGWLEVDSKANQGTCIRLSFPLPSVIQHAMVFRAANQLYALPMQSVQSTGEAEDRTACLSFAQLVGRASNDASQQIVLTSETPNSESVGTGATERVTLLVDEIVGPEELVVRPLPALLKHHPYCSGATLSGMGKIVLFLDAHRVVKSHQHKLVASDQSPTTLAAVSETEDRPVHKRAQQLQPRVLVVDDSISARKRVVRSLRRYGVEIVEANDGKQALEILKKQTFAAIFSDMEMPHVSGMELLADVNSKADADKPPVVIISSRSEDEFTGRAKELGANNYLIKPLSDDALDTAIEGISTLCHLTPNQPIDSLTSGETL
jgi:chemotaxis protein histidine kinase CheA/ActR/RegA family two-component response regulator